MMARHLQVGLRDVCSKLQNCCQHTVTLVEWGAGSWMLGRRQKEMIHPALLTHRVHLMHLEQAGILSPGSPPTAYLAGPVMRRAYLLISCA